MPKKRRQQHLNVPGQGDQPRTRARALSVAVSQKGRKAIHHAGSLMGFTQEQENLWRERFMSRVEVSVFVLFLEVFLTRVVLLCCIVLCSCVRVAVVRCTTKVIQAIVRNILIYTMSYI